MNQPPGDAEKTQFGKFILHRELGKGGMAVVYLADMLGPRGFKSRVAVKCLHPGLAASDNSTDAFISEALLGGNLNHPNIVKTIELGYESDQYFIAMELVDGIPLSKLLTYCSRCHRKLPLEVVLEIAVQICEGLAYAHDATDVQGRPLKIIHRDLKPGNILLSRHGPVKITDFGVAKAASNLKQTTAMGVLKGTIGYMSPEQASCEPLDHRADLFSFGAILFAMLTLEPLYRSADSVSGLLTVMKADYQDRLPLLDDTPAPLVRTIRRLLAPNRDERHPHAAEVKRELHALYKTLPDGSSALCELVRQVAETGEAGLARLEAVENEAVSLDSEALQQDSSSGVSSPQSGASVGRAASGSSSLFDLKIELSAVMASTPGSPVQAGDPTSAPEEAATEVFRIQRSARGGEQPWEAGEREQPHEISESPLAGLEASAEVGRGSSPEPVDNAGRPEDLLASPMAPSATGAAPGDASSQAEMTLERESGHTRSTTPVHPPNRSDRMVWYVLAALVVAGVLASILQWRG